MDQTTGNALVPIVAITGAFTVAALGMYFRHRASELRHRERLAAIEKGIELPPEPEKSSAHLLRGLTYLFVGIGLAVFFLALSRVGNDRAAAIATIGLIPAGIGVAHLILYRVQRKQEAQHMLNASGVPVR